MSSVLPYLPYILSGFWLTVMIAAMSIVGELIAGVIFTGMRSSRSRIVRGTGLTLVELLRGTSEVIQMFWVFFALPVLLAVQFPPIAAAVLVLSLNGGAYASEVMRGGLAAVPAVQREACVALGIPPVKRMTRVIGPQAVKIMLPSLANVAINTAKATSVVSLITIADLAFTVQTVRVNTGQSVIAYLIALALYLLLTAVLSFLFETGERRLSWGTRQPRKGASRA